MNVTVKYEKGAVQFAERMLATRPTDDALASLAGALDGAISVDRSMMQVFRAYLKEKGLSEEWK